MSGVAEVSSAYPDEIGSNSIPVGYKQTEVGVIPEDWEVKKFTEVTNLITCGIAATPKYVAENEGYPFLSSTNVKNGKVVWKNYKHISTKLHRQLYRNNPPLVGDVLYSRVGTIGEAAVIEDSFEFSVYVSLTLIKPKREMLNSYYLTQLLNSEPYKNRAMEQVYLGGGVGNLNVDVVRNYPIVVPSLKEQTAIANALSDVDALISELEKLIAKKQAIKTATMQQLLTGRTRLPQFAVREDGTPKGTKPSELGEIPEDWEVVELGKLLAYEQPTNYLISHTKFLDEGLYPVLTAGKSFILGYTNEEYGVFTNLPVIIFDDFTTDSKFVDFPFKAKSSAMKMLKPINKNIPLSLIYNLLNSVDYLVGDHKRHWIGEFQFLNVAIPSKENEQTAIATILSDMDAEIQALEQRLGKTRQIKQGMMQELLTGKTRLVQPQNKECQHG